MTHELKEIVAAYATAAENDIKAVLATVVALEGSSYRRPGVRMLILSDGRMVGAVSGGCVEKEIQKQAATVLNSGIPKMMTYDGRYRLGCEGILYILLEPFWPSKKFLETFDRTLQNRHPFSVSSWFVKRDGENLDLGSFFGFDGAELPLRPKEEDKPEKRESHLRLFKQVQDPCFQLLIFGAEHDSVQLCSLAAMLGWEVTIVTAATEAKRSVNFPGATHFMELVPEEFPVAEIDGHSAVMVMNHSYAKDLKCLLALRDVRPAYLGLLGPANRKERLLNELMEYAPDLQAEFLDQIHGPAGLNIGAETPQEIALSILAEILSVVRTQDPIMLRNKVGGIHS